MLDKRTAWTGGVVLVLAGIVSGVVLGLGHRGDPDQWQPVRDTDGLAETPGAQRRAPPQGRVGEGLVGWSAADRDAVAADRLPPYQETFTDAELVSLATDMRTWRAGSRVAFEIPHTGATVESVIERVETGLGGNVSYIGRVVGQDVPHRMVLTVGERNAFAYVGSARGAYEMVGNREFGWLMTSAGMDRHVDYSKPDYYLPGDTQRRDP